MSLILAGAAHGQVLSESFTGAAGSTPTGWVFDGVNDTPELTGPGMAAIDRHGREYHHQCLL